jgi:hypothetical protein
MLSLQHAASDWGVLLVCCPKTSKAMARYSTYLAKLQDVDAMHIFGRWPEIGK